MPGLLLQCCDSALHKQRPVSVICTYPATAIARCRSDAHAPPGLVHQCPDAKGHQCQEDKQDYDDDGDYIVLFDHCELGQVGVVL